MRRATFYSSSRPESPGPETPVEAPAKRPWRNLYSSYERQILFGAAVLLCLLSLAAHFGFAPQEQAVVSKEQPAPSGPAAAYQAVKGAIVRVHAAADPLENDPYLHKSVGSGVVVVARGTILTSLHVVANAGRVRVVFADGSTSEAKIVSQHPDKDLAVLQADVVPDDLKAATMRPRADLQPGDGVVAVGFPFGIGPSVTAGVVSGLGRQHSSLANLIQFDAAVNPGSSGGPLLNAAGEVVGIVTAMLDPGGGGFAGIGFAIPIESASGAAGNPPF
ncbi:MAG TPA: trypsin-like peptidase domain-containing protein [Burkholderiales bacterium]|nr:trypsin-like peptidase domain-containing protein [Burkholderiales bacterium]